MARIKTADLSVCQDLKTEEQKSTFGGTLNAGAKADLAKVQADMKQIFKAHGGNLDALGSKAIAGGGKEYDQLRNDIKAMHEHAGGAGSALSQEADGLLNGFAKDIHQVGQP